MKISITNNFTIYNSFYLDFMQILHIFYADFRPILGGIYEDFTPIWYCRQLILQKWSQKNTFFNHKAELTKNADFRQILC